MNFRQWLNDWRWAMNVKRARAWRRNLSFSERMAFDDAFRPKLPPSAVIAYPDAFYHIGIDDLIRAMMLSKSTTAQFVAQIRERAVK